jgi:RimJ/RimL family protein N-acetyltransferase
MNWYLLNKLANEEEYAWENHPDANHDYDPSWDYEMSNNVDEDIISFVKSYVEILKRDLLPEIEVIKDIKVGFANLSDDQHIGQYIDGTSPYVVMLVDSDYTKTMMEEIKNMGMPEVNIYTYISETIVHELAHGIQEIMGSAFRDEDEAENFAKIYVNQGDIWKFWEEDDWLSVNSVVDVYFPDNIPKEMLNRGNLDPEISGFIYPEEDRDRAGIYLSDELVGFMTPREEKDGWRVGAIYIVPELRGKGIGSKAISEFFKDKKASPVTIGIYNTPSQGAFENAGFKRESDEVFEDENDGWQYNWWTKKSSCSYLRNKTSAVISFDFDDTLTMPIKDDEGFWTSGLNPNMEMIQKMHEHKANGDKIIITTFRHGSPANKKEILQFINDNRLPIDNPEDIVFTGSKNKGEFLQMRGAELHYDDDTDVIDELESKGMRYVHIQHPADPEKRISPI